ncbi:MAG: hypothetical protein JWO44_2282 [Bacteroidetes bacterium]|nr:hypothetical protein [Bacteroidota bacterium]
MNTSTSIYIYNENGIIPSGKLADFCLKLEDQGAFNFVKFLKQDVAPESTIFTKLCTPDIDLIIYDYGCVMKIEGKIKEAINLLSLLDETIDPAVDFYVSPSQRVENSEQNKFPRGSNIEGIAKFLDDQFCNDLYTSAINIQ